MKWTKKLPREGGAYLIYLPIHGYAMIEVWRDYATEPHCEEQEPEPKGAWMTTLTVPNPPPGVVMRDRRKLKDYNGCQFLGPLPERPC